MFWADLTEVCEKRITGDLFSPLVPTKVSVSVFPVTIWLHFEAEAE